MDDQWNINNQRTLDSKQCNLPCYLGSGDNQKETMKTIYEEYHDRIDSEISELELRKQCIERMMENETLIHTMRYGHK